ncbi:cobyric acid synthase [Gordonia effusa NBRC 100432]|uniref:Cobyric acid synthase n=1 Tax=Gordonia effusa NBRC 100432 TaxID=1077974 RepID=H0R256_9ACTN|nr:cobyric acid synthase [Gordonia effusa]GAB19161.1 cobyric acid synthase [Gordonia effusa NBRC 100432]
MLVGGTTSDAGKSLVVAGLCRALARAGVRVAPFKAQNMSNNSVVTLDGGEIGRAQAMQAQASGVEPSVRFNPVLLKPGSDRRSHVVVLGQTVGEVGALDYASWRNRLRGIVVDQLSSLRRDYDVVICEGAGSVAEINLRAADITNMGLARATNLPVVLVSDIDRGGSLAHLFGTTAILDADDQRLIAGYLINKFRGDPALLAPGLDSLRVITGRPTFGIIPFADGLWLDAEDSLGVAVGRRLGPPDDHIGQRLRVAAIRLPRISNTTDVEALACEPGAEVTWVDDAASVTSADLVVVPGTRATVTDLDWLRRRGLDVALVERAHRRAPILAICGGYQMLAREIVDEVESGAGEVAGIGLLNQRIVFAPEKTLRQVRGFAIEGRIPLRGYEIHHGQVVDSVERAWLIDAGGAEEGARRDGIWGTHWHGVLAEDGFRRAFLREVAAAVGKTDVPVGEVGYEQMREQQLDLIADLLTANIDLTALAETIANGAGELPSIRSRLN